uniref:Uncharacterized protein n=1 Tax=Timema cristinae TaxID=61476 RepID=A0A7R9DDB9_TIMCR|nr:unnamed protein product [Timema cristinae]
MLSFSHDHKSRSANECREYNVSQVLSLLLCLSLEREDLFGDLESRKELIGPEPSREQEPTIQGLSIEQELTIPEPSREQELTISGPSKEQEPIIPWPSREQERDDPDLPNPFRAIFSPGCSQLPPKTMVPVDIIQGQVDEEDNIIVNTWAYKQWVTTDKAALIMVIQSQLTISGIFYRVKCFITSGSEDFEKLNITKLSKDPALEVKERDYNGGWQE